jgi:hypothetical protein
VAELTERLVFAALAELERPRHDLVEEARRPVVVPELVEQRRDGGRLAGHARADRRVPDPGRRQDVLERVGVPPRLVVLDREREVGPQDRQVGLDVGTANFDTYSPPCSMFCR